MSSLRHTDPQNDMFLIFMAFFIRNCAYGYAIEDFKNFLEIRKGPGQSDLILFFMLLIHCIRFCRFHGFGYKPQVGQDQ
jgi:hypothetical protein